MSNDSMYTTPNATLRGLYSGGKDSTVASHIGASMPKWNGVAHVMTLTGPASIRHSQRVIEAAKEAGWHCMTDVPFTTLPQIAVQYRFLKDRVFDQLAIKVRRKDKCKRVIWISGVRRDESAAREQVATERTVKSANVWFINPLIDWTDADVREYVDRFGLSVANWHHSFDCFCGAYGDPPERKLIIETDEDQALYIEHVEAIARCTRRKRRDPRRNVRMGARAKQVTPSGKIDKLERQK